LLPASCWFLARTNRRLWKWSRHYSPKKSTDFKRPTRHYILWDRTLHIHRRERLKFYLGPVYFTEISSMAILVWFSLYVKNKIYQVSYWWRNDIRHYMMITHPEACVYTFLLGPTKWRWLFTVEPTTDHISAEES
jgi:hypothetical protein